LRRDADGGATFLAKLCIRRIIGTARNTFDRQALAALFAELHAFLVFMTAFAAFHLFSSSASLDSNDVRF
jgi:hypothetical protein